nr:methyltransferase domain-containing protein [uncultured Carboxylicivirga sp.]
MPINQYIYIFSYDTTESELCKLESRYLFQAEDIDKVLNSDVKIDPWHSAFIKKRIDIDLTADSFELLLNKIKDRNICMEGFKIEYLVMEGDSTTYADRLEKLKDIGYSIEGTPEYYKPSTTYSLCYYKGMWCFGLLIKNQFAWYKHKKKPFSYSNSINIHIAKALVNIAAQSNKDVKLLDACCGVGTIMLEACFAGYSIDGNDINWKVCRQARQNLAHFNYDATVFRSDIKDLNLKYDTAIIDLPYNLFSHADEESSLHIITSAAAIANRLVIVSIVDLTDLLTTAGLVVVDKCDIKKSGKAKFTRNVWVCDKMN